MLEVKNMKKYEKKMRKKYKLKIFKKFPRIEGHEFLDIKGLSSIPTLLRKTKNLIKAHPSEI